MNPQSTQLVRASWQRVESIGPAAAALFYDNLFTADPQLRPLFKGDMSRQGDRLLHMIGAAVVGLDDLPALQPVLADLARRHVGYGVQEAHYSTVGAALLKTLAQGLGDEFTPPVREAWTQVYGLLSGVMIDAARTGPLGQPH
jgi:hemoglobin-like flavoprotein